MRNNTNADFTPLDDAFFAEGERLAEEATIDTFDDLDDGLERPSFWDRLRRR